ALRILATAKGSTLPSALTRMPRSAPMASPVRMVSAACAGPIETTTTSVALPASFRRKASSTAISSNGFIDIFTLASSTPVPSAFTRILMSLSTTRFTGTTIFMFLVAPRAAVAPVFGPGIGAPHPNGRLIRGQRRPTSATEPADGTSAILARRPQQVARALVVGIAAGDEQEVG